MKLLIAFAGLLLIAACGGGATGATATPTTPTEPETFVVSGTFTLKQIDGTIGLSCTGYDGYSDIGQGAQIVVRDDEDTKIALGSLGTGTTIEGWCVFGFKIVDVPTSGTVYSVEISHRGQLSFSQSEAEDLDLTLG